MNYRRAPAVYSLNCVISGIGDVQRFRDYNYISNDIFLKSKEINWIYLLDCVCTEPTFKSAAHHLPWSPCFYNETLRGPGSTVCVQYRSVQVSSLGWLLSFESVWMTLLPLSSCFYFPWVPPFIEMFCVFECTKAYMHTFIFSPNRTVQFASETLFLLLLLLLLLFPLIKKTIPQWWYCVRFYNTVLWNPSGFHIFSKFVTVTFFSSSNTF